MVFLHGGDFHLDAPFHALSAAEAAEARREQRTLLQRFATLAVKERVGLVLLTGDLFDGTRIYPETRAALCAMLEAIPCPVFLAPGNHDPCHDDSPYRRFDWPENTHIFRSEGAEAVPVPALGLTVYGAAFTEGQRTSPPLRDVRAKGPGLHIGCFHGELTTQPISRYGPIHPDTVAGSGLNYLALGHIHTASGLQKRGHTYFAYPGCPQGRGFDETGEKGVYLGEINNRGEVTLHFRPLCLRQYRVMTVEITSRGPEAALRAALPTEPSRDIVRIVLTGESPDEGLDLDALTGLAAPRFHSVELRDGTRLGTKVWARRNEEGLYGLFLREMAAKMAAAEDEQEQETLELALRFGIAALEGRDH